MEQKIIKVLDKGYVAIIDHMGNDQSVIQAAKQSVAKEELGSPEEQERFIRDLMRWGHHTPFEFVTITFRVKAPLFVYRQWHRARTWSYVERSGRYTELPPEFYEPEDAVFTKNNPSLDKEPITLHTCKNPDDWVDTGFGLDMYDTKDLPWSWKHYFTEHQSFLREWYQKWLGTGVRKELARINLPLAQYSEMYATTDLRNLFHFLKLRMHNHAQYEIRQYANAIFELIKPIIPYSCQAFQDYVLNSQTLSSKDIEFLQYWFKYDIWSKEEVEGNISKSGVFSNKREAKECLDKLKKVFGPTITNNNSTI